MKKQSPAEAPIDDISGKKFDERVALRLLPYLRPYRLPLGIAALMVFGSAGVALYQPRLLGLIVDKALLPRDQPLLLRLVALFAGIELLRLVCIFGQSFLLQRVGQHVMQALRRELFARLLRMPVPFFDRYPVGKLVTRVTNDTVNLSELFSSGFVMLISDVILIVGVIAAMLTMNWKLGLAAIAAFPVMLFVVFHFSGRLREVFRASRDVLSRLNAFYAERVQGMPLVQLMEREGFERRSYGRISSEYRDSQFAGVYLYSIFHPAITVLSAASIALVLWFGPGLLEAKEIPLGTFVSFLAYVQVLYQPVRSITDRYNVYLAAMASAERVFTLLEMPEEEGIQAPGRLRAAHRPLGPLRFENVSFSYPRQIAERRPPALAELSFGIGEGETVAVVGHTGAGKSTLTSLLFRFYEPGSGRILFGGQLLSGIPKRELRERIGFVQQEVFLFSGTLRENLALLRQGLGDEEIIAGCEATGFSRVVGRLPRGLDTMLDERGANLSLGERQILAFTRVFLQQPDFLVLDEASSSVDRQSEQLLQQAARRLTQGRSSLVIAHRLETVRHADRILVLEHGRLVEEGSHDTLLARAGRYARFVELQQKGT